MKNTKVIVVTAIVSVLSCVGIQQLAYRNSAEYKFREAIQEVRKETAQKEQKEKIECDDVKQKYGESWFEGSYAFCKAYYN